ncbi:MAG: hypothetical protein IT406_02975 [Candidatus Yanofskybacteria bacterium]|nr:hypothetical protein [Candidatus Yanofskybacteria bacterium]
MPKEMQSFGVAYSPGIKYARDWACPECGWEYELGEFDEEDPYVVGFSPEQPWPSRTPDTTGILIIECPRDFTRFWFHTTRRHTALERARHRIVTAGGV